MHHPDFIEDEPQCAGQQRLKPPIPTDVISRFLAFKMKKDGEAVAAISTMGGYMSAIAYHYVSRDMKMPDATARHFKRFRKGASLRFWCCYCCRRLYRSTDNDRF